MCTSLESVTNWQTHELEDFALSKPPGCALPTKQFSRTSVEARVALNAK